MPTFAYRARTAVGEAVAGTLTAENERIVLNRLGEMALFPVEVREQRADESLRPGVRRHAVGRVRHSDLCLFARQLADLLVGGVPLVRGLETLARQSGSGPLSEIVAEVKNETAGGKPLAETLRLYPRVFSSVFVNMVAAGEEGGFLGAALDRVAEFMEKSDDLRSRLRAAFAYPIFLSVFGALAVGFLLVFVVPILAKTFQEMGGTLPLPTQILIALNQSVRVHGLMVAAGLAAVLFVAYRLTQTEAGRLVFDGFRLRAPLLARVTSRLCVSRFARTLGTLLDSGVPILSALRIARDSTGNQAYARVIEQATQGVRQGARLADVLRPHREFPPVVVDMIAVGEESGRLGQSLVRVAERYERDLDNALRVLLSLVEPSLLIIMGGMVLFIVLAMLLPVFTMNALVQ
ncbi:MAG: type II secretion system F family protein [Planctomycetes bacterium]|nr:type II secretion system F family protein [Planctomycetota bacterium]